MLPTEREDFVKALNALATMKPGVAKLTREQIGIWWHAMEAWSLNDFKAACAHLVKSMEFMPSPYHFERLRRAGDLTGPEAWTMVLNGVALEPGSRIARAAAAVGGQYHVRHADLSRDVPHIQRRFLEAYEELSDVDFVRSALPQIAGDGARVALRAPAPVANFLPQLDKPRDG